MSADEHLAAQLAGQLFSLAATLTDGRHDDELLSGLESLVDALGELAAGGVPHVPSVATTALPEHFDPATWYRSSAANATPLTSDVDWSASFVEIEPPASVTLLDEWGPQATVGALSPLAITAPFRILSDAGLSALQTIAEELDEQALDFDNDRVPRHSRGAIYRSRFLQGLHTDQSILRFLGMLARTTIEPHPNGHHASHFNFAPSDPSKAVDPWHTDVTAFDAVMHVHPIDGMRGGQFEYYAGAAEEGRDLLLAGEQLPPERIVRPEFPGPGWMVLQQGHRVLHHATALEAPWRRCTYVPSYLAYHPVFDEPEMPETLVAIDGPAAARVEYARHRCVVASRRLRDAARVGRPIAAVARAQAAELDGVLGILRDPVAGEFLNYGTATSREAGS